MSISRVEAVNPPASERRPIVASVNEAMAALKIGRAKTYELINSGSFSPMWRACPAKSYGRPSTTISSGGLRKRPSVVRAMLF